MSGATLKARALRAAAGELVGIGGSYALRLLSTLILSRLLFPEAFGLAALVGIFNYGLVMLSDVGLLQSVVQDDRGDDKKFLNTVWTFQILRGVALWILACALAWPMAATYGEADLLALISVGSTSVLIQGFASTSLMTLRRRLAVGRLVRLELAGQVVSLLVTVGWALLHPSVWAIVAGGIVNALFHTIASHRIDIGYRNGVAWDQDASRRIVKLGRWVYGSSALTFVGRQSDRLLLGHFMGVATLGIYTIAVVISEAVGAAVERITRGVLFPLLSEIQRDQPDKIRTVYYDARLRLDGVGLPLLGVLMAMAQTVIEILYDPRYFDAGWMLQALCLRVAMIVLLVPAEVCLFAIGQPRFAFDRNVGRTIWVLIGVPLAWMQWGLPGIVWVTATAEIPSVFILWRPFIRAGLLRPSREVMAVGLFAAGLALGWAADRGVHAAARSLGLAF